MKMTEYEKRNIMGIFENESYTLDFIKGKMIIKDNTLTEQMINDITSERAYKIYEDDKSFEWRQLINEVEFGPNVTVLNGGLLSENVMERVVIPSNITASKGYVMYYASIGEIVFEGEIFSFAKANGMLGDLQEYEGNPPRITCGDNILNSLLANAEKLGITDEVIINGKKFSEYSTDGIKEVQVPLQEEAIIPLIIPYNEVPTDDYLRKQYELFYALNGFVPFIIKGKNFKLDLLTKEFSVTDNALTEEEVTDAVNYVNSQVKFEELFEASNFTNKVTFTDNVTRCPGTIWAHYEGLSQIYLPANVVSMGFAAFSGAGEGNLEVVIANPNFDFIKSRKSLAFSGNIKVYFGDGNLPANLASWLVDIANEETPDQITVLPFKDFHPNDEFNSGIKI